MRSLFQALIGTVETDQTGEVVIQAVGFQALIGTVETLTVRAQEAHDTPVSSPHRYCRNTIARRAPRWVR